MVRLSTPCWAPHFCCTRIWRWNRSSPDCGSILHWALGIGHWALIVVPLSVLDLAPVRGGASTTEALREAVDLAQFTERLGYLRYWFAEHHGMASIASSSPEILIEHIADRKSTRLNSSHSQI